jgi:aminopeptidase YwaD
MTSPIPSIDQQIVGDIFTSTAAMENLTVLCDEFGSRFGGTEGERLAAEFLQAKLAEYGLKNVHSEPFEYLGWRRGEVSLEITSPIQRAIPCITLPHSPPADFEAEVFDMGEGAPEDFDRLADQIEGKIVMANSVFRPKNLQRRMHRKEKYARSVLAGSVGFIFVNHYPGYGPATGGIGHKGQAALIPGVSLSYEDGAFIQRLAKRAGPVQVRLVSSDQLAPMVSWNILGELPGSEYPNEIVMLGSHYDGHDISQGAGDPASGAVSVLEAARVLAKYGPAFSRTIHFAFWGVEEIGLLGSRAYVKAHTAELDQVRFYFNMDAAGMMKPKDIMLHEWPELQGTFERYREEMALDFAVGQSFHSASDHYPFLLEGVTTGGIEPVRVTRTGRGYGHTRYDTVDKVSLMELRQASDMGARLAWRIASDAAWPATCRDQAAVAKLLERPVSLEIGAVFEKLEALYEEGD